ncbi:MAG TPA: UDP-N-acetylmuramoyl-tripeptide--D-alanyl-D-alanine ligase [Candidatus Omnitrophica bacterium]|nr:UDP-N-acetylmuramoyl-tripeptide--D-alanyl-D-alanine ligase [Candidatus Omnitrophota bacterium]
MSLDLSPAEIKAKIPGLVLKTNKPGAPLSTFSIDTRTLKKGDIFIALKGQNHDGHKFIKDALALGAKGVVYDSDFGCDLENNSGFLFLKVSSCHDFIYKTAQYRREKIDFPILAITGSCGKTTVKELSAALLSSKFCTYRNYLNQNNMLGLSLNILNCSGRYDFGLFELGISKKGDMDELLRLLKPKHGLITNVNPVHLEYLMDEEGVLEEKLKLFEYLKDGSYAFYPGDDIRFKNLKNRLKKRLNFKTFGFKDRNDYWLEVNAADMQGLVLKFKNGDFLRSSLLGRHNAFNISAALAVAVEFGVDFNSISKVLSEFKSFDGRMKFEKFSDDIDIINDGYNSNPAALMCGLEFISGLDYDGVKTAVLSDMLELGERSGQEHYNAGSLACGMKLDYYFCYGENMKYFIQGLKDKGFRSDRIVYLDVDLMAQRLFKHTKTIAENKLLFFKASCGMNIISLINRLKVAAGLQ